MTISSELEGRIEKRKEMRAKQIEERAAVSVYVFHSKFIKNVIVQWILRQTDLDSLFNAINTESALLFSLNSCQINSESQ